MVIGLVCAVVASLCYGAASVLQAVSARRTETPEGLDPRLLIRLFGQLPYLIGVTLDGIGFIASVFALQLGQPLFVVQAIVAASVGVTAAIVAIMGTRLGRNEWLALAAIGVGLVLLALSAGPENDVVLANGWYWVMLAAVVPVALIGAAGLRVHGVAAAVLLGLGAGLGFAITAVASRTLVVPDPWWHLIGNAGDLGHRRRWSDGDAALCHGPAAGRGDHGDSAGAQRGDRHPVNSRAGVLRRHHPRRIRLSWRSPDCCWPSAVPACSPVSATST